MTKEIKDFKVIHPTGEDPFRQIPEHQPLYSEPKDPYSLLVQISRNDGRRLTATGHVWLFFPWIFLVWKRLQFTLLEMVLTLLVFGLGSSIVVQFLQPIEEHLVAMICCLYLVLHTCLLGLTFALYDWMLYRPRFRPSITNRTIHVAVCLGIVALVWGIPGIILLLKTSPS